MRWSKLQSPGTDLDSAAAMELKQKSLHLLCFGDSRSAGVFIDIRSMMRACLLSILPPHSIQIYSIMKSEFKLILSHSLISTCPSDAMTWTLQKQTAFVCFLRILFWIVCVWGRCSLWVCGHLWELNSYLFLSSKDLIESGGSARVSPTFAGFCLTSWKITKLAGPLS